MCNLKAQETQFATSMAGMCRQPKHFKDEICIGTSIHFKRRNMHQNLQARTLPKLPVLSAPTPPRFVEIPGKNEEKPGGWVPIIPWARTCFLRTSEQIGNSGLHTHTHTALQKCCATQSGKVMRVRARDQSERYFKQETLEKCPSIPWHDLRT